MVHRSWDELSTRELYSILKLRTDVFFVEQRIDEEELDNRDFEATTRHLWIADDAGIAAYLRVLYDAEATGDQPRRSLGRVVVRADRRGEGLAGVLVARVIELYGAEAMVLHSQHYVTALYAKFGFEEVGDVYVEAGIPHISMHRAGRG